jgi:hypothetical protein
VDVADLLRIRALRRMLAKKLIVRFPASGTVAVVALILRVGVNGRQLMPIRLWHGKPSFGLRASGLCGRLLRRIRAGLRDGGQDLPQFARPEPARDFLLAEPVEASRVTALF